MIFFSKILKFCKLFSKALQIKVLQIICPKFWTLKKKSKFRKRIRLLLELEPLGENVEKNFQKKIRKKKIGKFSKKKIRNFRKKKISEKTPCLFLKRGAAN